MNIKIASRDTAAKELKENHDKWYIISIREGWVPIEMKKGIVKLINKASEVFYVDDWGMESILLDDWRML